MLSMAQFTFCLFSSNHTRRHSDWQVREPQPSFFTLHELFVMSFSVSRSMPRCLLCLPSGLQIPPTILVISYDHWTIKIKFTNWRKKFLTIWTRGLCFTWTGSRCRNRRNFLCVFCRGTNQSFAIKLCENKMVTSTAFVHFSFNCCVETNPRAVDV